MSRKCRWNQRHDLILQTEKTSNPFDMTFKQTHISVRSTSLPWNPNGNYSILIGWERPWYKTCFHLLNTFLTCPSISLFLNYATAKWKNVHQFVVESSTSAPLFLLVQLFSINSREISNSLFDQLLSTQPCKKRNVVMTKTKYVDK